jgi:ribosomal protein L37AE/L43A
MSEVTLQDREKALEDEYFRRQEQELIAKMKEKLAAEENAASDHDCPKCEGKLVESDFQGVKVDVCNECHGVWFDAGELAQATEKDADGWFSKIFGK